MTNSSEPPAVHETSNSNTQDVSEWCPFCTISSHYGSIDVADHSNPAWDPDKLSPPAYVILSTENVVAFLDIAPLTRGHVLVAPRKHRTKMGDFRPDEMAEIGKVLPIVVRAVLRATLPDIPHEDADYNIVQNNGPGAAQVIPHVHFHIIPRPPLNYVQQPISPPPATSTSTTSKKTRRYPPSRLPTGIQQSYISFGRGQRHELDDDDAVILVQEIRKCVAEEWRDAFHHPSSTTSSSSLTSPASQQADPNKPPQQTEDTGRSEVERFTGTPTDAAWIEGSGGLVRNLERRAGIGSTKL